MTSMDLWAKIPLYFQDRYALVRQMEGKNLKRGVVFIVQNKSSRRYKVLKINFFTNNESSIFAKLPKDCPYIMYPEESWSVKFHPLKTGEILLYPYYRNGDVFSWLDHENKFIPEQTIHRMFTQIYNGVAFLHKHNILHLDLKVENVLLDDSLNIKICDFDLSKYADISIEQHHTLKFFGTPQVISPEMYTNCVYGVKTDVWGLGEILTTLAIQQSLHESAKFEINLELLEKCDKMYDPALSSLLRGMLKCDLATRYTMDDVLKSQWMIKTFP